MTIDNIFAFLVFDQVDIDGSIQLDKFTLSKVDNI